MCVGLAVALVQANEQCASSKALPAEVRDALRQGLRDMADYIGGCRAVDLTGLLEEIQRIGRSMDEFHEAHLNHGREELRRLFIMRVALAIAVALLQRYRHLMDLPGPLPLEEGAYAR
ncbi:hypothetical protein D9M68_947050 [compost metagenome]